MMNTRDTKLKLVTLSLLVVLLSVLVGCTANARVSDSEASKPEILIIYSPTFGSESASGLLNLLISVTINNKGYFSFNTSPLSFSVEVDQYSYEPASYDLQDIELEDGGKINGNINFLVPPQAASTRVGFKIKNSGQNRYNITWIKAAQLSEQVSADNGLDPIVDIAYSTSLMWLDAPGTQYLKVEPPGNLYLVVEMTIENKGYESFNTAPEGFSLEVSSLINSITAVAVKELIDWRVVNVPNGGKYIGSLVFQVPTEVAQSFYKWDYKMKYSGSRSLNVRWTKLNVSRCTIDANETVLNAINLANGEIINGKLAFKIAPELAASNARYEMVYDKLTSHNVQWFDQADSVSDVNRNPISYPVIKITYSTSIMEKEDTGRLYLIVDMTIANMGYDTFFVSPAKFFVEVTY